MVTKILANKIVTTIVITIIVVAKIRTKLSNCSSSTYNNN